MNECIESYWKTLVERNTDRPWPREHVYASTMDGRADIETSRQRAAEGARLAYALGFDVELVEHANLPDRVTLLVYQRQAGA